MKLGSIRVLSGNIGPASQTLTYSKDTTPPVITLAATGSLNCNPSASEIAAAFGAATVNDDCSSGLTASGTVGAETLVSGCTYSTIKSWTVTDSCGNIGTASQTLTYRSEERRVGKERGAPGSLNCNQKESEIAAAFGGA